MPAVTVRNLSDDTHQALKRRAAQNGRSTEAEIRSILDTAVRRPPSRNMMKLFDEFRRKYGPIDLEIERDQTPAGSTVSFD